MTLPETEREQRVAEALSSFGLTNQADVAVGGAHANLVFVQV